MSIKINQNIFSLLVQRNLNRTSKELEQSYAHLSSGERITRSADDPAGMAASEQLRYEIQGLRQNQQNVSGASSLLGTAESYMDTITDSLQRARELAVQGGNDTLSAVDRQAIQTELKGLLDEINRVASTARFGDRFLLNGQLQNVSIQIGTGQSETLKVTLLDFRTASLGARAEKISGQPVGSIPIASDTIQINGYSIPASQSDGLSTAQATSSAIAKANAINGVESQTGVHASILPTQATGSVAIQPVSIDGTTRVLRINGVSIGPVTVQANDSGGSLVQAINNQTSATGVKASVSATGILQLEAEDGRNIEIATQGSVGGLLGLRPDSGDVNRVETAKLTLTSTRPFTIDDPSGALGMAAPLQQIGADPATAIQFISVSDSNSATQALQSIDAALAQLNNGYSIVGALSNRLESLGETLAKRVEDLSSADSRIRDADFAFETARLTQAQILQEAAIAMLTQANVIPQRALDLLRG